MINRLIFFSVFISSIISCSTIRIEKKRYSKGFFTSSSHTTFKKNNLSKDDDYIALTEVKALHVEKEKTTETKIEEQISDVDPISLNVTEVNQDTVRVTLKNGKVYQGVITQEKENGIFLQISPQKTIYLSRFEIEEIVLANKLGKSNSTDSSDNNNVDDYVTKTEEVKLIKPKPTDTAEILFYVLLATTIFGITIIVTPFLLIIGSVLAKKGYLEAYSNPDKYDVEFAEKIKKLYKIFSIVFFSIIAFMILIFIILFLLI